MNQIRRRSGISNTSLTSSHNETQLQINMNDDNNDDDDNDSDESENIDGGDSSLTSNTSTTQA